MLPSGGSRDCEFSTAEQSVGLRVAHRKRRDKFHAIEIPRPWQPRMAVGVANSDPQRDLVAQRNSCVCAGKRIRERVVYSGPVAVELIAKKVEVEASASAGQRCVAVGGLEISSVRAETELRDSSASRACPDLHHTRHGIGAIQGALRPAQELHAVGLRQRQSAEVERDARFADVNAIDNHFVVSGLAAANKK